MKNPSQDVQELSLAGLSFGPFRLDADGALWRDETMIHLTPKELAALQVLVAHTGRIVSPLQLKHALWGDVHVTADSVPKCLSSLRTKLEPEDCIQTVYKRGYRFSAEVRRPNAEPAYALPRLAILPFSTGYAVPEHLGMAIAEEAIVRLVSLEQPVAAMLARDSVFALALRNQTAQQIGEALKANLVLTGTLTAMAAHYRLRAEMIRVEDGTQIWVEDLLVPQSSVAQLEVELVQRVLLRMNRGEYTIATASAPVLEHQRSPHQREAWEIYLHGHHEWQSMQRHRMQDALQHLQRALQLDATLTAARIDIANLSTAQALYGFLPSRSAAAQMRLIAATSPEAPTPVDAILPALGWVRFHIDHDLPGALRDFEDSAHLPHDQWTTHLRFLLTLSRHRFAEAIAMVREALLLDPFSPWLNSRLAWALHLQGQAAESVEQIDRTIALFPNHESSIFYGGLILSYNGEAERALKLAQGISHRFSYFDIATATHAYALACAGRNDEARTILERLQWLSRERFVLNTFTPAVHVVLGEVDAAIAGLRTSLSDGCPWFFQMLADPRLKPLHGHPEFEQMCEILPRMEAGLDSHPEFHPEVHPQANLGACADD